ncbi:MAG: hypothetical protein JRN42_05870 [Nitrososphaerota archaeon]|nr:hypothetical protein [Nitrososphaerota archaeon]
MYAETNAERIEAVRVKERGVDVVRLWIYEEGRDDESIVVDIDPAAAANLAKAIITEAMK